MAVLEIMFGGSIAAGGWGLVILALCAIGAVIAVGLAVAFKRSTYVPSAAWIALPALGGVIALVGAWVNAAAAAPLANGQSPPIELIMSPFQPAMMAGFGSVLVGDLVCWIGGIAGLLAGTRVPASPDWRGIAVIAIGGVGGAIVASALASVVAGGALVVAPYFVLALPLLLASLRRPHVIGPDGGKSEDGEKALLAWMNARAVASAGLLLAVAAASSRFVGPLWESLEAARTAPPELRLQLAEGGASFAGPLLVAAIVSFVVAAVVALALAVGTGEAGRTPRALVGGLATVVLAAVSAVGIIGAGLIGWPVISGL